MLIVDNRKRVSGQWGRMIDEVKFQRVSRIRSGGVELKQSQEWECFEYKVVECSRPTPCNRKNGKVEGGKDRREREKNGSQGVQLKE